MNPQSLFAGLALLALSSTAALAHESFEHEPVEHAWGGENFLYLGAGAAQKDSSSVAAATPWSIGYLHLKNTAPVVVGVDIAGEGIKLDSTWGQTNAVTQAVSFNLLLGRNLGRFDGGRVDAAVIIGGREKTASCRASYVGYQCYANTTPDTTYAFNYGAAVFVSFEKFGLGLRATPESVQALAGLRW